MKDQSKFEEYLDNFIEFVLMVLFIGYLIIPSCTKLLIKLNNNKPNDNVYATLLK